MMVALLLYGYAVGERSSRRLERRCVEDVATRVICANQAPDHTTIARFRQRHERALAELFGEVLALCAEAGLVRVGVIAVDGTKVAANAAPQATRDYEQIAREILAEADAVDAEEDERSATRAATSCRPSWRPRRAGAAGCARPSAASTSSAPRRPGRSRATGPNGSARPSAGSKKSTRSSAGPTRPMRPIGRAASTRTARSSAVRRSRSRRRRRRRGRSISAIWTRATSRPRAAGCRATTPRRWRPRIRSSSPPRSPSPRRTSGTSNR